MLPAFLTPLLPPRRPRRSPRVCLTKSPRMSPRMSARPPAQDRVLRLERALAKAVQQQRFSDAATLRDALHVARTSDPLLSARLKLADAVANEDFATAARLRDQLASLTAQYARGDIARRINRIIVLRGRADSDTPLRVSTVSPEGDLPLPLVPPSPPDEASGAAQQQPRVYLQPTWSPSGDYIAMTEITFNIDPTHIARGIAVVDAATALVVLNAFDGSLVRSLPLKKPPFFFYWTPDGHTLTLLSNDPTSTVTTVALSALQVVAPEGGEPALPLDKVSGPLASGHPFLYDFCPRDSSRVVAHIGDCDTVAILPISMQLHNRRVLTSTAGAFGTPQWHPLQGHAGREVVFFVEAEPQDDSVENAADDNPNKDDDDSSSFDKFLSNGTSIFESVLRKGAESLGLSPPKVPESLTNDVQNNVESIENRVQALEDKLRGMLGDVEVNISISDADDDDDDDLGVAGDNAPPSWDPESKPTVNRLVMCDVDNPELRRTLTRFKGVMAFKLSHDGKTLAMLVTNPTTGEDEFTLSRGDFSPDSVATNDAERLQLSNPDASSGSDADIILSTPNTRVVAFFWSPDSSKLLFLCTMRDSRLGAAQWATFDMSSSKVVRYEKFVMSSIYIHCLNFFDQFAMSMTPWSPDSDAFCYPGRPLSASEIERDVKQSATSPISTSGITALLVQKDGSGIIQRDGGDGKRFLARLQKVPDTAAGKVTPEDAVTIVDNVEYACWSPC